MSTFIDGQLPDDKTIIDQMSRKAFEVESVDQVTDADRKIDSLFEIKVLPNRVADAMSLAGMATELAAIFDLKIHNWKPVVNLEDYKKNNEFVEIKGAGDPVLAFYGVKVTNKGSKFSQTETPEWIKDILVKCGGRSINSLVDITNLILFSLGQPAHVFDGQKLSGKIIPRFATEGEEIELLGEKKLTLKNSDFVIADESGALGLAGIKGGKKAEVDENTIEAVFELANFNPIMIRKSSQRLGIRTDASKIYENGIATDKTLDAFKVLIGTIKDVYKDCEIEFIFAHEIVSKNAGGVMLNLQNVNNYAGKTFTKEEVVGLLAKQNFKAEEEGVGILKVTPPADRLDINIEEDLLEEILRIYGFDNLESKELIFQKNIDHNPRFLFENYLKLKLIHLGYTEIFSYTFLDKGNVKVKLGLASDKEYLRNNLLDGAKIAFTKNYNFMPVLETDVLKFFEIGTVFLDDNTEEKHAVLVCDDNKKKTKYLENLQSILNQIETELGIGKIEVISSLEKPAMLEFSVDKIVAELVKNNILIPFVEIDKEMHSIKYTPLSIYPFIVRDIAIWVPEGFDFESLKEEIVNLKLSNMEKIYKFDEFSKEGKTSLAFRIIFQSNTKTLTDVEVEVEMQKVYNHLQNKNLEIR